MQQKTPYYSAWLNRLNEALKQRGRLAQLARDYAKEHDQAAVIAESNLARIKSGRVMAGGEVVCFVNAWLEREGTCGK